MPHIVAEYSNNIENDITNCGVLGLIHKAIADIGLFSPEAVKSRSIAYDSYILPEGDISFLHITISILSGRSVEQRDEISKSIFFIANDSAISIDKISVDINEMDAATYSK